MIIWYHVWLPYRLPSLNVAETVRPDIASHSLCGIDHAWPCKCRQQWYFRLICIEVLHHRSYVAFYYRSMVAKFTCSVSESLQLNCAVLDVCSHSTPWEVCLCRDTSCFTTAIVHVGLTVGLKTIGIYCWLVHNVIWVAHLYRAI